MNQPARWPAPDLPAAPRRVVSLVPSVTESLFDLGAGERLVGITDYCIHPAEGLRGLPRLGGPKNPRLADLCALQPDLVIANPEENTRRAIEALQAAGIPVWLIFPQSVEDVIANLGEMARLFGGPAALARVRSLEMALGWIRSTQAERPPVRAFCPIWFDHLEDGRPWWMTFNRRTYCSDLLSLFGGVNLFADRDRRYPLLADLGLEPAAGSGERDTRYPRVSLEEVIQAGPELIILPDEPYPFEAAAEQEIRSLLESTPAVQSGRVHRVDGSLITWAGTRLGLALRALETLFPAPGGSGR